MQDVNSIVKSPVCSVCIANYNGEKLLEACIQSVLDQDSSLSIEIIVHDDASDDDSLEMLARLFPQVRVLASRRNVGFCVANHRMASLASGEFLLFLNNDAALFPDAVSQLHAAALRSDRPAILGLPQYDALTGGLEDRGRLCDPFLNPIHNLDQGRLDVAMVAGACLWIPKSLWSELGGFPTWFGTLAEDLYLCSVARLRGYPVRVLPTSGFRHWIGASIGGGAARGQLSTTFRRRALSERNKCFTLFLCYPAPWHLLALFANGLLLLLEGVVLSIYRFDSRIFRDIYFWALKGVWEHRLRLLEERKRIQAQTRVKAAAFFSVFRPLHYKLVLLIRYGFPAIR